jgi:hypothetical protein
MRSIDCSGRAVCFSSRSSTAELSQAGGMGMGCGFDLSLPQMAIVVLFRFVQRFPSFSNCTSAAHFAIKDKS